EKADQDSLDPVVSVNRGTRLGQFFQFHENNRSWRVVFDVEPLPDGGPVELRCFLRNREQPLSETWTYLWIP
ncbi:MAG: glucan biosynthesis protein, partial [Kiritimatiellia bacterium]|nr:glucan biosynthesis protein [Kiritimatiellia bacterium]